MFLKFLLFFNLMFDVNELHFDFLQTGIPAVAPINIIFLLIIWQLRSKPEILGPEVRGILRQPMLIWFGMITLGFIISELRGTDRFLEEVTYYKNALFYPLYYFIYLRCRQDEKTTRWLIIWILVVAAVAGLEGLREGLDFGFGKYRPDKRASGPFGKDWANANRAGVFYAMFMPMFISLALFLRKRLLWRLAAVGGCILIAGGAISTYSRQAYGMIVLSLALLLVRKNIAIAALVAVMAGTLVTYLPDAATQRVEETSQKNKAHGDVDASTASRWEIWAAGMDMFKEHPLGVGFHKFSYEIGNYSSMYKGYDAHNFYVLTLCENGPQTLIAYIFVLFTLFRIAAFVRTNMPADDPEGRALAFGFTITTLCVAIGGLYGSPIFEGPVMGPYWALCGLLERYTHMLMNKNEVSGEAPPPEASLVDRFPLAAHILPGKARP
jgi:O-antigen ligase